MCLALCWISKAVRVPVNKGVRVLAGNDGVLIGYGALDMAVLVVVVGPVCLLCDCRTIEGV